MMIISRKVNDFGIHSIEEQSHRTEVWMDGFVSVPDDLRNKVMESCGFCDLVIEDGVLTDILPREIAVDIEALRAAKLTELSAACRVAIVAGCDVTLSSGETEHFALTESDQINLAAAASAVAQGAEGYPYHADGQLCRLYPAADILAIVTAAERHKLYHTTYCNHLMTWVRRLEDAAEIAAITYGAELPDDLAEHMKEVLSHAEAL